MSWMGPLKERRWRGSGEGRKLLRIGCDGENRLRSRERRELQCLWHGDGLDQQPLFDTPRYARTLEQALRTMVDRCRAGEAPDAFLVT